MSLAYKIYAKGSEYVYVWGGRVVKHLLNGVEVNDVDNKETGEWLRDGMLFMNEDKLKELGFILKSQT